MILSHRMKDNICIIHLEGECTFEWVKQLDSYCMDLADQVKPGGLVINLEKVLRIDSAGIGTFAMLTKHLPGKWVLCMAVGDVADALRYVKLDQIIPIFQTEKEALASFHS
ncbi:MAG: STAS domain-containing protein [SAR324 cluster bacterium]|nr:STAS domain-containing protein [SAR324 cluster bacterium]